MPLFSRIIRLHTIKGKLALIGVLVVSSLMGVALTASHAFDDYSDAENLRLLVSSLQSDMLMLRRNEKDFLARKDAAYKEKFDANTAHMVDNLNEIAALMAKGYSDQERENTSAIAAKLTTYQETFSALVSQHITLGLDHDTGLHGELRAAVHRAESGIKAIANYELLSHMLMLRRNEKDFLQRLDLKYQDKFNQNYHILMDRLSTEALDSATRRDITANMQHYHTLFSTLVEGYTVAGLNHNAGLLGDLRASVHAVEEILQAMSGHLLELVVAKERFIKNAFMATFVAIAIVLLTTLRLTARSILVPVNALIASIKQVTQSCNFRPQHSITSDGEIGDIAQALDGFYDELHRSLSAANGVMDAVAEGDFSQRITVQLKGELAELKQAVNASADSVMFNMEQLDAIMTALQAGDFSARMDTRVEKNLRDNIDQAMQTMDSAIGSIGRVLGAMSEGDFSQRVDVELTGELHQLKQRVNKSMQSVDRAVSEIVEVSVQQKSGDLAHRIEGEYSGQLGILKNSMNATMGNLEHIMMKMRNAADTIHGAADEIVAGNRNLSSNAEKQASSLEETASSMTQISGNLSQTAENAQYAKQLSDNAKRVAESGGVVVRQAITAMEDINTSSAMIANIIDVINDLAFQTNLLALNAAVESARAGAQGRGFAVVASEVGALAGRSATAAGEIKELIESSVNKVRAGTELVNKSGKTLDEIMTEMDSVQQVVSDIAISSKDQTAGLAQVSRAVNDMDAFTQNNVSVAETANHSSDTMKAKAADLDKLVSFFKVSAGQASGMRDQDGLKTA